MNVNPDLAEERSKATFTVPELTNIFDGGPQKTKNKKILCKILFFIFTARVCCSLNC